MMSKIKWKFYMLNISKTRKKYSNYLIYTRYSVYCSWQNVEKCNNPSYALSDCKAEQSQAQILETALASEKENFHRLKVALDTERIRSREAIDRDNETILDLRTALEARKLESHSVWKSLQKVSFHNIQTNLLWIYTLKINVRIYNFGVKIQMSENWKSTLNFHAKIQH